MKRPWTPGPWGNITPTFPNSSNSCVNLNLAIKSPEMAELLIEVLNTSGIVRLQNIQKRIQELLKEIGYEEET